jgi:hypothetical protein
MWRLDNDSERGAVIKPENNVLLNKQNNQTNVQINLTKSKRGNREITGGKGRKQTKKIEIRIGLND